MHKGELGASQTYAVIFGVSGRAPAAGGLTISELEILLVGGTAKLRQWVRMPFAEIANVHIAPMLADRLNGRPTLVLEREHKSAVKVAPLGAGLLHELFDLLLGLTAEQRDSRP